MTTNSNNKATGSGAAAASPGTGPDKAPREFPRWLSRTLRWAVCLLSVALIVYVSIMTFDVRPFLQDTAYMDFQFCVCVVFLVDFFVELYYAPNKGRYWARRWLFLLLSIPWLNFVAVMPLTLSEQTYNYIRFIPLARGALALAIVSGYIAKSRIGGLVMSYFTIMTLVIYFGSLVFFTVEAPVNPGVTSYPVALWWAALESTTYGADIYPVTGIGRAFDFIISGMGIIMYPLFTVYLTTWVKRQLGKKVEDF